MGKSISIDEALNIYGIRDAHEHVGSDELRFRLRSDDQSSYVRTVATESHWQGAHHHRETDETYIVQNLWMAIATERRRRITINRFKAGSVLFVTRNEHHDVFLPKNAVIHTIKQGGSLENDRFESPVLRKRTIEITESQIAKRPLRLSKGKCFSSRIKREDSKIDDWPAKYDDSYRHFDNLIWQLPTWSTAVFAAILYALRTVLLDGSQSDPNIAAVEISMLIGGLVFFLGGYFALYRWRVHQRYTRRKNAPKPLIGIIGGQLFLQVITGVQGAIMLVILLRLICQNWGWYGPIIIPSLIFISSTVTIEASLTRHIKKAKALRLRHKTERRDVGKRDSD